MGERVTRCYRLSDQKISGETINDLGETLTSKEMQNKQSFVTWNFDTIWTFNSKINDGYPHLRGLSTNDSGSNSPAPSGGSSSNDSSSDASSPYNNPLILVGIAVIAIVAVVAVVVFIKKNHK